MIILEKKGDIFTRILKFSKLDRDWSDECFALLLQVSWVFGYFFAVYLCFSDLTIQNDMVGVGM